jgi:Protein of unknwon function (DUF3310)
MEQIRPTHYQPGNIECIEVIKDLGDMESFCRGNAIKYLFRSVSRHDLEVQLEDLTKARTYIDFLIDYKKGKLHVQ